MTDRQDRQQPSAPFRCDPCHTRLRREAVGCRSANLVLGIGGSMCSHRKWSGQMSVMTGFISHAPSSPSATERWSSIKAALNLGKLRLGKTSVDDASFYMLNLYRANLEVRLRTIDESTLQSDCQKKIYATVIDMLKSPAETSISARNLEWDEIYKAESLIGMLYDGARLEQEIRARLQELAIESPGETESQSRDYERLSKPTVEGQNSGPDNAALRAFLLRLLEAIHWNAKKKYLVRPIRIEATNRILS